MRNQPGPLAGTGLVRGSAAQTEPLDEAAVAVDVHLLQVAEESATLADEEQEPPAGVVVVLVGLEVLGEVLDPLGQQRDLDLGGTGVALVRGVLGHDGLLRSSIERHDSPWFLVARRAGASPPGLSGSAAVLTALAGYQDSASSPATAATSACIWATSSATDSKRSVSRNLPTRSTTTSRPYSSRSVRSSTYASTRRSTPSKVGFVPIDTAAGSGLALAASAPGESRT